MRLAAVGSMEGKLAALPPLSPFSSTNPLTEEKLRDSTTDP